MWWNEHSAIQLALHYCLTDRHRHINGICIDRGDQKKFCHCQQEELLGGCAEGSTKDRIKSWWCWCIPFLPGDVLHVHSSASRINLGWELFALLSNFLSSWVVFGFFLLFFKKGESNPSSVQWSISKGSTAQTSEKAQGDLSICIRESRSWTGIEKSWIQQDEWEENLKLPVLSKFLCMSGKNEICVKYTWDSLTLILGSLELTRV